MVQFFRVSSPKETEMKYTPIEELDIELLKKQLEKPMDTKFLEVCMDALDTDPSTPDGVKDEVGCAETLSTLIKKIYPDFPVIFSTKNLDWKLYSDKRFKRITEPELGCIIISPRNNIQFGHCGVFITSQRIASNNSQTGLFQGNYFWDSWIREFKDKRGLKIYIYKLVD